MQQPPLQDPTNSTSQPSPYPQSEQPAVAPPPPASSPDYNVIVPASPSNYPGEEHYYSPAPPVGGPVTQYQAGRGKLVDQSPRRPNVWRGATLVLLALVIILAATTVLGFSRANNYTSATVPSAPTATPSPTSLASTSTPASSPTSAAQTTATVASGTVTENILLSCGGCNDPIRVTITTIQVDDANGRMIWNTTLKDVAGNPVGYSLQYNLQANASQTQIPATFSQSSGNLPNNESFAIQAIFAFVPTQNTMYTFTAIVGFYESTVGSGQITFNPVQVSL